MKAKYRIAIVDDSHKFGEGLKNLIKHEIHVDITLFTTGEELLRRMKSGERFDLYILDYQLDRAHHKLWGDEVCKEANEIHKEAKILFMATQSSIRMLSNRERIICIPKDASTKQIVETVKDILGLNPQKR